MTRYFLIILIFICANKTVSQINESNLVNITKQDGLPSNETYCVFKDSKNYIWIASDQGVVRHKGSSIQVFNNLPDNVVFKIREDQSGRIWFFSHTGKLAFFYKEKLYPYIYNDSISQKIKNITINDGYISKGNEIDLVSVSGFNNYRIDDFGKITNDKNNKSNVSNDTVSFKLDNRKDGHLFILNNNIFTAIPSHVQITVQDRSNSIRYNFKCPGQINELFGAIKLDTNKILFWFSNSILVLNSDGSFLSKTFERRILSAYFEREHNQIIVGFSKDGLKFFDKYLTKVGENSMNNYSVSGIDADYDGDLWFSTLENGVYHTVNRHLRENYTILYDKPVQRIASFGDSDLLFANKDGVFNLNKLGVSFVWKEKNLAVTDLKLNSAKNLIFSRTVEQAKNKNYAKVLNCILNENLLVSGQSEILKLNDTTYFINLSSYLCKVNFRPKRKIDYPKSVIWSSRTNGIEVQNILEKDSNNLFLGTKNSLYTLNMRSKSFNFILNKGITYMARCTSDIIALGIRFGGLTLMKDTSVIGTITEMDGLLSNSIKYILLEKNRLWLATPNGISVVAISSFNPLKYTITNFGENMGLNNLIIYQLVGWNEKILAATSKGIYRISNIDSLLQHTPKAIPLFITTIKYFKGDTSGINQITLPYNQNRLTVNFDAICYNTNKEIQYFYRIMDSKDTSWIGIHSNQIILEKLNPGSYELHVKAELTKQHRFSNVEIFTIIVEKPWWQLNLVRIVGSLLIFLIIYLVFKNRLNRIKKREKEKAVLKTQMIELEQTALRSQMNPHFIFNCLSSIQQLVVSQNTELANEYLVKFAQLIRKTLELSSSQFISLAQEKEYLTEYVFMEQLRLPDKFSFNFIIEKNINGNATQIPNMMLQPIVENAIRHGIKHLEKENGVIEIMVKMGNNYLTIEVLDNGIGRRKNNQDFAISSHKSFGLEIIKKRLTGLPGYFKNNYFLEIKDLETAAHQKKGTKVILQLPFIQKGV